MFFNILVLRLVLDLLKVFLRLGMVVHACNPSTWKAEIGWSKFKMSVGNEIRSQNNNKNTLLHKRFFFFPGDILAFICILLTSKFLLSRKVIFFPPCLFFLGIGSLYLALVVLELLCRPSWP